MSIWTVSPITETPEVDLEQWKVVEVESPYWDGRTRHFVGYNLTEGEGRVSSAIQQFDAETMQGITRSGRVYRLVGNPGHSSDAEYVWDRWCRINQAENEQDVTMEITNGS